MGITAIILFVLLFLDQLTKYLVEINIVIGDKVDAIPNFLTLTKIYNTGAAWGSLSDSTGILVIISVIGTILLSWVVLKNNWKNRKLYSSASTLMLAGCFGNLIDRFISITPLSSGRKGVVDMISFEPLNSIFRMLFKSNFPIFNIADAYLTIGVVLFFIYFIFIEGKEKNV